MLNIRYSNRYPSGSEGQIPTEGEEKARGRVGWGGVGVGQNKEVVG
jgi:hypothetical protein